MSFVNRHLAKTKKKVRYQLGGLRESCVHVNVQALKSPRLHFRLGNIRNARSIPGGARRKVTGAQTGLDRQCVSRLQLHTGT